MRPGPAQLLLAASLVAYTASMFLPIDRGSDEMTGWAAAYVCLAMLTDAAWHALRPQHLLEPRDIAPLAGAYVNLVYLITMGLSWKLRGRAGTVALLHSSAWLAALAIPPLMEAFPVIGTGPGRLNLLQVYGHWAIGYWLWTGATALAMLVWAAHWFRARAEAPRQ